MVINTSLRTLIGVTRLLFSQSDAKLEVKTICLPTHPAHQVQTTTDLLSSCSSKYYVRSADYLVRLGGILALRKKNVTRHSSYVLRSPLFTNLTDTCLKLRYRYAIPDSTFTMSMWTWNKTQTYKFTGYNSTAWAEAMIPVPTGATFRVILNVTVGKSLNWRTGALSIDYMRKTRCFAGMLTDSCYISRFVYTC